MVKFRVELQNFWDKNAQISQLIAKFPELKPTRRKFGLAFKDRKSDEKIRNTNARSWRHLRMLLNIGIIGCAKLIATNFAVTWRQEFRGELRNLGTFSRDRQKKGKIFAVHHEI